jgi:hypothetical protein
MRSLGVTIAATLVVAVNACGGDDSGEKAETTKTVTSEFLTIQSKRGYLEATTPGSGGFIETPQARGPKHDRKRDPVDELDEAVPEIKRAPGSGESVFTGVLRDAYLRARAACRRASRKKLARRVGVDSTNPVVIAGVYAAGGRLALWQAAFEGCAVGIASR